MHCDEAGPLLLRRLEGRLEADEGQRLEQHLEQCEACRETLEAQRRVATVLSEIERARPSVTPASSASCSARARASFIACSRACAACAGSAIACSRNGP